MDALVVEVALVYPWIAIATASMARILVLIHVS